MVGASRLIRRRLVVLARFGLTPRLWYCYLYPCKKEPAQPPASRRQLFIFVPRLIMISC